MTWLRVADDVLERVASPFEQLDMTSTVPCTCPGTLSHESGKCTRPGEWVVSWFHVGGSLCWHGTMCDPCNTGDIRETARDRADLESGGYRQILCREHLRPTDPAASKRARL